MPQEESRIALLHPGLGPARPRGEAGSHVNGLCAWWSRANWEARTFQAGSLVALVGSQS